MLVSDSFPFGESDVAQATRLACEFGCSVVRLRSVLQNQSSIYIDSGGLYAWPQKLLLGYTSNM